MAKEDYWERTEDGGGSSYTLDVQGLFQVELFNVEEGGNRYRFEVYVNEAAPTYVSEVFFASGDYAAMAVTKDMIFEYLVKLGKHVLRSSGKHIKQGS